MEGYLRLFLLFIGAVIVVLILLDARQRRRQRRELSEVIDAIQDEEVQQPIKITRVEPEPHLDNAENLSEVQSIPETIQVNPDSPDLTDDVLAIMLVAKPGSEFASYELFQAIAATGMQFGEMNIFHYYTTTAQGREPLFSLTSAKEPGEFDLDKMGEFSCSGLIFFTNLSHVPDAQEAFVQLLKTADQLAEDLHGDLYSSQRVPLNNKILRQYQEKVSYYQRMKTV